jgi:hypothetical protein
MSFKYDKDNLFKEFEIAKAKDISLSKKKTDEDKINDIHTNRIQFCKDHAELKKSNPMYYEFVDINFENLLKTYQSADPRDTFYQIVFGKSYLQKKFEQEEELYGEKLQNI